MGIGVCDQCSERYVYDDMNTELLHQCHTGVEVLDKEPVLVIGNYTDSDDFGKGTTTVVSPNILWAAGFENVLQGTIAGINGEKLSELNSFGLDSQQYRLRQKFRQIETSHAGGGNL